MINWKMRSKVGYGTSKYWLQISIQREKIRICVNRNRRFMEPLNLLLVDVHWVYSTLLCHGKSDFLLQVFLSSKLITQWCFFTLIFNYFSSFMSKKFPVLLHSAYLIKLHNKQECIPIGCIPPTSVATMSVLAGLCPLSQGPPSQRPYFHRDPPSQRFPGQRYPWTETPWTEPALDRVP